MQSRITGCPPQQIRQQCGGFGTLLKGQITDLSLKPEAQVLNSVQRFVVS